MKVTVTLDLNLNIDEYARVLDNGHQDEAHAVVLVDAMRFALRSLGDPRNWEALVHEGGPQLTEHIHSVTVQGVKVKGTF